MALIAFQTMPIAALILVFLTMTVLWARKARSKLPLPLGLRPLPLIGNLYDMPMKHLAPALRELGAKYGECNPIAGPDRLPEFSDRDSLPYINAVVKGVIRWHTVVPLDISHRVMEEDEYKGYRIPAGTILVPNAWAMSRDPQVYPEPDTFVPERFMKDGTCTSDARDPEKYQFGICPGRHFAKDALFITVASVLHVFNIKPPLRPDGTPAHVTPNINLDTFLSYSDKFECTIAPQPAQAETLVGRSVRSEFGAAMPWLERGIVRTLKVA